MNIRIQSVKFDADSKLLEFVEKKVGKIEKFHDNIIDAEVTLSLLPDQLNKEVKVKIEPIYDSDNLRPVSFKVKYNIDGQRTKIIGFVLINC